MGKVLETGGGDGGTTVCIYLIPLSHTLKMVNTVTFLSCRLCHRFFLNPGKQVEIRESEALMEGTMAG